MVVLYFIFVVVTVTMLLLRKLVIGMQALQQSGYYNGRYQTWLKSHMLTQFQPSEILMLIGAFVFLTNHFVGYLLVVIGGILSNYSYYYFVAMSKKLPLKFTWRVKRMILTYVVLSLLFLSGVTVLGLLNNIEFYIPITLIVWSIFTFLIIQLVNLINTPIEKAIRNRFINEAKKIVRNHSALQVIGITGSYGKTSTKHIISTIVGEKMPLVMTPESYNTPMGITITIRNLLKPIHKVFVCEMGAYKQGEITELVDIAHPNVGVLTSIGPQHLETYKTIENVQQTKFELIEGLPKDGLAILNFDDLMIRNYQIKNNCNKVYYSLENKAATYFATNIVYATTGMMFDVIVNGDEKFTISTPLLGKHNIYNILAGVATAFHLGITAKDIVHSASKLKAPPHRLEIKKMGKFTLIDDAFNANPVGSKLALEVLNQMPGKKIVITPGMIDLGPEQFKLNASYAESIAEVADFVVLVGKKQAPALESGLNKKNYPKEKYVIATNIQEALQIMNQKAEDGSFVLLANDLPDIYLN